MFQEHTEKYETKTPNYQMGINLIMGAQTVAPAMTRTIIASVSFPSDLKIKKIPTEMQCSLGRRRKTEDFQLMIQDTERLSI